MKWPKQVVGWFALRPASEGSRRLEPTLLNKDCGPVCVQCGQSLLVVVVLVCIVTLRPTHEVVVFKYEFCRDSPQPVAPQQ